MRSSSSTLSVVGHYRTRHDMKDLEEDLAAADQTDEVLTDEEAKARRQKKERWTTAAGVYVSWRPPDWAARNSRRL